MERGVPFLMIVFLLAAPVAASESHDWYVSDIEILPETYDPVTGMTQVEVTFGVEWDTTDDEDDVDFRFVAKQNGTPRASVEINKSMSTTVECSGMCMGSAGACGLEFCSVALGSIPIDGSCYLDTTYSCGYDMEEGVQHHCTGCTSNAFVVLVWIEVILGDTLTAEVEGENDLDQSNDSMTVTYTE
jgi:hypothetical protein